MSRIRLTRLSSSPCKAVTSLVGALLAVALLLPPAAGAKSAPPPPVPVEPWAGAPFAADPAAIARAAAKVPSPEGEDVVVLLSEAFYSFDAAGRETFTQRLVYKILTAGAHESWSTVEEDWAPWHQTRPEIRARVITPDGAEHLIDPATITENANASDSPDMFEDGRVLRAPLPATRPGAIVEQQVTVRDESAFFDGGVVRFHNLDLGVPVLHARVALEAPEATPLRWVVRELPGAQPRETVAGGRRRVAASKRATWSRRTTRKRASPPTSPAAPTSPSPPAAPGRTSPAATRRSWTRRSAAPTSRPSCARQRREQRRPGMPRRRSSTSSTSTWRGWARRCAIRASSWARAG